MSPGVLLSSGSFTNGTLLKHINDETLSPYKTSIPSQPITVERPLYVPRDGDALVDAGTARATYAPSRESPYGSVEWAKTRQNKTIAQQHVEYFDQDADGIIWPRDTYAGFRAWGWSIPLALLIATIIHVVLSYPTAPGWLPDRYLRIFVERVYKIQHGSDTMTFDMEGRYVPQNFENIFTKYDKENKGGLTWGDVMEMARGQRQVFDFFGWNATLFEWSMTYLLLWPEDGVMKKEDIRCCMDGSIFYKKADEYKQKELARANAKNQSSTSAGLAAASKKSL